MTTKEINQKLESLVGSRFTEEQLNKKLSELFCTEVKVAPYEEEEEVKRDLPELDEQLLFPIELHTLKIDVDLFYLKDNGGLFYITETNFEYQ